MRTFIKVDFPAPFSPRMPWTRPRHRVRSTLSQATTWPNRLVIPISSTAGGEPRSPPPTASCTDVIGPASVFGEGNPGDLAEPLSEVTRRNLGVDLVPRRLLLGGRVADDRARLGIDADLELLDVAFLERAGDHLLHHGGHVVTAVELDGDVVVQLLTLVAHLRRTGAHGDQAIFVGGLHD